MTDKLTPETVRAALDAATPELLPCPFCGAIPEPPVGATRMLGVWRITHRRCVIPSFTLEANTPALVAAKWNTRATSYLATAEENERLRAELIACRGAFTLSEKEGRSDD